MEGSDTGQCLTSYKLHDISRLLKNKFKTFDSKENIDSDLIGALPVSCASENVGYHNNKSKEICSSHRNVIRQADILEKELLEQQLQSFVDEQLKVLESNFIDVPEERTSPQLKLPSICNSQNTDKEAEQKDQKNQKNKSSKKSRFQVKRRVVKDIDQSLRDIPCKQRQNSAVKLIERGDVFVAIPAQVYFQDYEIGKVYEINILIRNIGRTCRTLRIIPPQTPFFSIGLGQFPTCTGSIAPGLHCTFAVKFCPDSLANFEDCISVEVERGDDFDVPLRAVRPPPVLKMPACFNMGDCLLGKSKSKKFTIKNEGAYGKFCIVPECRWPGIKLKTLLMEGRLCIGNVFELKTIYFELSTDETIDMEITFCPSTVGNFCETVLIVCDNCQVKRINIAGGSVVPKIALLDVEGGWSCYCENDMKDISAKHLLRFSSINPHSVAKKKLLIQNCINVDVPYKWINYYSEFKRVQRDDDDDDDDVPSCNTNHRDVNEKMERRVVSNSKFSVEPKSGILPAWGIVDFHVTFSPEEVGKYQEVIHFEVEFSKNMLSECDVQEETSQTFELIGTCSPHSVFMHPRVILLPAPIPINGERKHSVKIVNKSSSKVSFKWENVSKPYSLTMHPTSGYVSPESELTFELSLFSKQPHTIDHNLCCCIDDKACLLLRVVGEFMCPRLEISKQKINFGLISPGHVVEEEVMIKNPSSAFISWFIHADESMDFGDLTIQPDFRGSLRPHEEQKLTFSINSSVTGRIHHLLKLSTYTGNTSTCFEVEAEVQMPMVCLEKCRIDFKDVRPKKEEVMMIKLVNKTAMRAFYEWKNVSKEGIYMIKMNPWVGSIEPRGSLECKVAFLSFVEGTFCDIVVPCKIKNSRQHMYLCISAEVKKPQVSFDVKILDNPRLIMNEEAARETTNPAIDFGSNNKVGSIARKYLLLTSLSSEEEEFNLNVVSFCPPVDLSLEECECLEDVDKEVETKKKEFERQRKCLQKKLFKKPGSGAMFVIHPSRGTICPNGKVVILVAALSDTFGFYADSLLLGVGSMNLCLSISYGAVGCPVYLQMMASSSSECPTPTLWFGKFYRGNEEVTRNIEIVNFSSIDVLLDWNIALKSESDTQVVDIVPEFDIIRGGKVIRLKMITHKGLKTEQENPFQIRPKVTVVPAKNKSTFEFKFYPPLCHDGTYSSIASAFVAIASDFDRRFHDMITRKDKYDLNTLDLSLHAEIVIPNLSIWHELDEGLRFLCTAGDLLLECSDDLKEDHMEFNKSFIVNEGPADVEFEIITNAPFGFSVHQCGVALPGIEPRPEEGSKYFGRSNVIVLKPGARVKVKFMFYLTPSMLKEDSYEGGDCCEDELEKKLHFMDDVILNIFSKSGQLIDEQNLPLYATVVLPKLRLSKECVDFGPCFVNQTMTKIISLTNTSPSASRWMIEPCVCGKFGVSPTCGAFGKSKKEKTTILEISFTPTEVMDYDACFVISGVLEECPIELIVKGSGVMDEHLMY